MPATIPEAVQGMVATRSKKVKPLGYMVIFSVPDREVTMRALRRAWSKGGLEVECLPKDPRALYLFKRAVRKQESRTKNPDGSVTETDVKDAVEGPQHCIYQISFVVRDRSEGLVEYPRALTVIYNKDAQEISFKRGDEIKLSDVKPTMDAIVDYFEQNTKVVDGRKVRTLIRKYLTEDDDEHSGRFGVRGVSLRGKAGGVYFVAERYKARLDGLADAIEGLYAEDGLTYRLMAIPMADDKDAREKVRAHQVANIKKEAQEAILDVARLLRSDRQNAVRSDVLAHWTGRLQSLRRVSKEYEELLKAEEDDVQAILSMLDRQIGKVRGA